MLTSIVQAKITPQGIETPLGILTVEQIDKGGEILAELESILEVRPPLTSSLIYVLTEGSGRRISYS